MLLPVFEYEDLRENWFKLMTSGEIVRYCKKRCRITGHKRLFLTLSLSSNEASQRIMCVQLKLGKWLSSLPLQNKK